MHTQAARRKPRVRFLARWSWCILLVALAGCAQRQADILFYRFAEDAVPDNRWQEHKVTIAAETRNVLSTQYRSVPKEIEIGPDGSITVGTVAELDRVRPDAVGITVEVEQIEMSTESAERKARSVVRGVYVPLPSNGPPGDLADTRVQILPPNSVVTKARAWAREVLPLPREHSTKPVRIPESARLDFGMAIDEEEPGSWSSRVGFAVDAECDGARRQLFSRTLEPHTDGVGAGWVDGSVDLAGLAGSTARFIFTADTVTNDEQGTASGGPPPFTWSPVWSSPILHSTAPRRSHGRPNLVLISLDTLRADHLGCYGYRRNTSPNIDRFAEGAVLFQHTIAPSPWTTPSHASVFTGLHPSIHGAGRYIYEDPYYDYPIEEKEITLAELARRHGYLTAAYTEGAYVGAALGFAQGFELYSDRRPRPSICAEETFGSALRWVTTYGNLPFVLFIHTYEPHVPYAPPRRFAEMFDADFTGTGGAWPLEARSQADRARCEAWYDGEIAYTDTVVGEFLAELERLNLLEDTVVILFSDHGEGFWEHGRCGHGHTLYEEVLRVPLIVRLAGASPPTGRVGREVSLTDLYATCTELLGIDRENPPDCISLLPLIDQNASPTRYERKLIVSELSRRDKDDKTGNLRPWRMFSIRTDDEKYLSSELDQTEQLYDLRSDPRETNNIAPENQHRLEHYAEIRERFLATIAAHRPVLSATEPRARALTEEERLQFKAIGYL
jgi:arylsulfatase A-like enzyme